MSTFTSLRSQAQCILAKQPLAKPYLNDSEEKISAKIQQYMWLIEKVHSFEQARKRILELTQNKYDIGMMINQQDGDKLLHICKQWAIELNKQQPNNVIVQSSVSQKTTTVAV